MRPNVVSEASLSTRASQWWASVPIITSGAVIISAAIYIIDLLVGYDTFQQICFSPETVIGDLQVYRAYTSVVFHASLLHVVFNMLALVPIGSALERIMGSVRYLHMMILVATTNAMIHLAIGYLVAHNPLHSYPDIMRECQIGFSGILFAMIVIESSLYTGQSRSIFGLFNVPAKWYPWVLLILFQFLMPRVSLLGHLSGILSGFAYAYGCLNIFLLSQSACTRIESSWLCALCMRRPGFILGGGAATGSLPSFTTTSSSNTTNLGDALRRLQSSIIPRREVPADQRFPGTGRTLGGTARPQQTAGDSETDLEARLLDDDDLELVDAPPVSTGGLGGPPVRPVPSARTGNPPAAANQAPQADKDAALRSLVAMGFEQNQANVALSAANGDITTAVEILSSQAR